jgi:hypothetical protein
VLIATICVAVCFLLVGAGVGVVLWIEQDRPVSTAAQASQSSKAARKTKKWAELIDRQKQQASADRQRADEAARKARQATRQQILARLEALSAEERAERERLVKLIQVLQVQVSMLEDNISQLRSEISSLQLDVQLGRAFRAPRAQFGMSRESVLQSKLLEYKKYQTIFTETQASLREKEQQLHDLPVRYERERNRLRAELTQRSSVSNTNNPNTNTPMNTNTNNWTSTMIATPVTGSALPTCFTRVPGPRPHQGGGQLRLHRLR